MGPSRGLCNDGGTHTNVTLVDNDSWHARRHFFWVITSPLKQGPSTTNYSSLEDVIIWSDTVEARLSIYHSPNPHVAYSSTITKVKDVLRFWTHDGRAMVYRKRLKYFRSISFYNYKLLRHFTIIDMFSFSFVKVPEWWHLYLFFVNVVIWYNSSECTECCCAVRWL